MKLDTSTGSYTPGLHLVLGPPNAGKLGYALRWWAGVSDAGPLLVVPSLADVEQVRSELLERVSVVFEDRPVCTMDHLVACLLPEAPPILGEVRRALLLQDLLASTVEGPLARVARYPGARQALAALIDELGEGGLGGSVLRAASQEQSGHPAGVLLWQVAGIVQRYAEGVACQGRVDRHQALSMAAGACAGWRRPVAFHGFQTFTPAQRRLLRSLALAVPVLVTLATAPAGHPRAHGDEEARRLRRHARSVVEMPRQAFAFSSPAIAYLEGSLLAHGHPPLPAPPTGTEVEISPGEPGPMIGTRSLEGVRFMLSAGRRHEAEAVGAEIVSLMRSGVPAGDVAVLVRDVAPWQRLLGDVFTRFRIPHAIDGLTRFGATGLGHALLRALRGLVRDDLDDLLAYLRTPYHPALLDDIDTMEVDLRTRGGAPGAGVVAAVERRLPGGLHRLREAVEVRDGSVVEVGVQALSALASHMVVTAAAQRHIGSSSLAEDARALRALVSALRDLDGGGSEHPPPAPPEGARVRFDSVETAIDILSSLPVSLASGDALGVVTVGSVRRARPRRYPVVFLLGLVDGEFPGPSPPPGLLGPVERSLLRDDEGEPLRSSDHRSDDAALFASAVSRAWQLLYLSARDAEDDGSEVLPSHFWSEARNRLPEAVLTRRRGLADVVFEAEEAPTSREFLRACAARGGVPTDPEDRRRFDALPRWECRPVGLSDPSVLGELAARSSFSATELEAYVACPFRWFADRVVGLNTIEESLGGLQAGTAVHRALKEVYARMRAEGISRLTPATLPSALEMLPDVLQRACADIQVGSEPPEERLFIRQIERRVRWLLEFDAHSDSELRVLELEYALPPEGAPMGGFQLRGRVDRVDEDPETGAVVVIDYKYGSEAPARDLAAKGALQIPLYTLALSRILPDRRAAGGVYAALGGKQARGVVERSMAAKGGRWTEKAAVDEPRLREELEAALNVAREAADGIRAGHIGAEPLRKCPRSCDLHALCRLPGGKSSW